MIRLINISLELGSFALRSINLEIEHGEYFSILGPTGAGKTKLLEIIAGLQAPDSGEIWIGDRQVNELPPERRHVGFMYQDYLLFPHLSVRKNIAFGLRGQSPYQTRSRIADLSRLLKIDDLLNRNVADLSGGEQQRVGLARALAPRPHLLLLDEPLSALDPQNRRTVRRELNAIHRQLGMTTIHVTHDFEEALVLSDRLAVINNGEIMQVGAPEDVFRRPTSTFVAGFVGVENLFRGEIVPDDKGEPHGSNSFNAIFRSGPLRMLVIAEHEGPAYAAIRPEEITIATEPSRSSALNSIYGTLVDIEARGPLFQLTFEAAMPMVAVLTRQSFASLQLEVGSKAYLSFKASAVHIFY